MAVAGSVTSRRVPRHDYVTLPRGRAHRPAYVTLQHTTFHSIASRSSPGFFFMTCYGIMCVRTAPPDVGAGTFVMGASRARACACVRASVSRRVPVLVIVTSCATSKTSVRSRRRATCLRLQSQSRHACNARVCVCVCVCVCACASVCVRVGICVCVRVCVVPHVYGVIFDLVSVTWRCSAWRVHHSPNHSA